MSGLDHGKMARIRNMILFFALGSSGYLFAVSVDRNRGIAPGQSSVTLKAFFDETGTHAGHPITGIAGVLYDDSRLETFNANWKKHSKELTAPFHTHDCHEGRNQFEGWPRPQRLLLMHYLAEIIADTKLAGFIVFVERTEWEHWKSNSQDAIVRRVGSPYSACLLHCISMVRSVVKKSYADNDVLYTFESGCDRQPEAEEFLYHLERHDPTRRDLRIRGHRFRSKEKEPVLCAADFLAWEWQRNYLENQRDETNGVKSHWRSEFKIVLDSRKLHITGLSKDSLSVRAIINFFDSFRPHERS